jgi:hypothetical protein
MNAKACTLLLRLLAAGWLGWAAGAAAADAPGPALTWQVSPDRRRLSLEWHDPAGVRAVLEWSRDLRGWYFGDGHYNPGLAKVFFGVDVDQGVQPSTEVGASWRFPRPPIPFLAHRVRSVPRLREGRVTFANRVTAVGINAPVTFMGNLRPGFPLGSGPNLASGADFLAQLVVEIPGVYTGPVGVPVPFRTGAAAGYVSVTEVVVPMADGLDEVRIAMTAWVARLGWSYHQAESKGVAQTGISPVFTVRPTVDPTQPGAPLVGLQPFMILVQAGRTVP